MSQQTSICDFYKSVSLRNQARKTSSGNPKKKSLSLRKIKDDRSRTIYPSKSPRKSIGSSQQTDSMIEIVDLVDSGEENLGLTNSIAETSDGIDNNDPSNGPTNGSKTPKSCASAATRTSDENKYKRSLSASRSGASSSPKKRMPNRGSRSFTKYLKNRNPTRGVHREEIDAVEVTEMVALLNSSRLGIVPKTNIDLEKIYSANDYGIANTRVEEYKLSPCYDINKVIIPSEKHAVHLFCIVKHVFLNPHNCGYFDNEELDLVFNILSLSEKSQMLFARLIKRQYLWRRSSSIVYREIDENLRPYFDELEERGLIATDTNGETLETLLNMLSTEELHGICRRFKMPRFKNKNSAVKGLLRISYTQPLFHGMESPATTLRLTVLMALKHCICLPRAIISLVDRIVTLFIPSEDISTKRSDIFLKLTMIKEGTLIFPDVPVQSYPVFQNRDHLLRYVRRKNEWREALEMPKAAIENWKILKTMARQAHCCLNLLLAEHRSSCRSTAIPRHVQKFREEYICIKIIETCLEVFKKDDSTIDEAIGMLRNLIAQEIYLQSRKSEWYEELALIQTKHKKNPEAAAVATIEGLMFRNITETGRHILTKRASILAKRKTGINTDLQFQLKNLVDKKMLKDIATVTISANVVQGTQVGRKTTWSIDIGGGSKGYTSVEHRAQCYYKNNGYPKGWHCEGSLPLTLFTLLFWHELYYISIPAAYLSAYQKAPLDLYTSEFYNNRKEQIDSRVEMISSLNSDQLADLVGKSFEEKRHYESLMPTTSFVNSQELVDITRCMGSSVVAGICKRLALNFSGCRAGFPDLFVWNSATRKCKFVEVKGPRDTLSPKQTLWLQHLENFGAVTELCEVKAN